MTERNAEKLLKLESFVFQSESVKVSEELLRQLGKNSVFNKFSINILVVICFANVKRKTTKIAYKIYSKFNYKVFQFLK